jgi:hypothetical protein
LRRTALALSRHAFSSVVMNSLNILQHISPP